MSPFPKNNLLSVQIVVLVKKYYSGMNRNISNYYSKLIDGGSAMAAEATAKDSNGNNALHLLAQEKSWMISNMPWSFCLSLYWRRITMKDYVQWT